MKKYSTKKALIASVLMLAMCFSMLIGTTFAWFTDSVTSANNIIKTGNLDVEMYYADGTEAVGDTTNWINAKGAAIYTAGQLWEPGYTDAKHIKVSNEGTLALKYQLAIIPTGVVSKLADVIDVYLYEIADTDANATQVANRDAINEDMYVGSLAEVISKGIVRGSLAAGADYTTTIVLKMQESAGNEYMNLSIGDSFTIQLLATQYTAESDSFDNQYDKDAYIDGWRVYDANDLQAAVSNAEPGDVIVLENPIEVTEPIVIPAPAATTYSMRANNGVVINLNGKTLSAKDDKGIIIRNYGTLALAGEGTIDGAINNYAIRNEAGSSLTINDGIVVDGGFGAISCFGATVTINGGDFSNEEVNSTHYVLYAPNGSNVVINGGTFTFANDQYAGSNGSPILAATNGSTIEINGGTFDAVGGSALCYNANNIIIKGGSFKNRAYNTYGANIEGKVAEGYKTINNNNGTYTVLPVIEGVELSYNADKGMYWNGNAANNKSVYYIFNANELVNAASNFVGMSNSNEANYVSFQLMADIDMAGIEWTPWSVMFIKLYANGHTVSNLSNSFFGYAGAVTVDGLTLENVNASGNQAGIFAASAEGTTLTNCVLKGDNTVTYVDAGQKENGVGVITGVAVQVNLNVTIDADATVVLDKGTIKNGEKTFFESDLYGYKHTTYATNSGTITNNGTVTVKVAAADTAGLQNALNTAADGYIIYLLPGVTYETVRISGRMGANVTVLGAEGAVVKGMEADLPSFTTGAELRGFTLKNVAFEEKGFYIVNFVSAAPWGFVENFTMDGCSFKGTDKSDLLGNRLFDIGTDSPSSHQFINLKITNCTVDTAVQGIRVGALRGNCEISGNTITNVAHNGITLRSVQQGTTLVKGNKISNGGDRALRVNQNSATVNFVDNVIVDCGDPEDGSNFKSGNKAANAVETFTGNTVNGEAWNPLA